MVGALEGSTEAASSLEQFLTVAARAVMRGVSEFKSQRPATSEPTRPLVPTASFDDMPPVLGEKPAKHKA